MNEIQVVYIPLQGPEDGPEWRVGVNGVTCIDTGRIYGGGHWVYVYKGNALHADFSRTIAVVIYKEVTP